MARKAKQEKNEAREIVFHTIGPYTDYMNREDTAYYLGASVPTFDLMLALSRSGKLKPSIPIFRRTPNGKPFFRKSKMDEWIKLRELVKD